MNRRRKRYGVIEHIEIDLQNTAAGIENVETQPRLAKTELSACQIFKSAASRLSSNIGHSKR